MNNTSTAPKSKNGKTLLWIAGIVTVAAILDHIYLLMEHYTLRFGAPDAHSLCNINEVMNCAAVSASKYAEFLGVPMALWGAAANVVLLLLLIWFPLTEDAAKPAARRNLLIVSGFIALTSVVMGGISSLVIAKFCPFCMLAYLLSFISFASLWFALKAPAARPASALSATGPTAKDFMPLAILAAVAFVGAFIANDSIAKSFGAQDLKPLIQESVQGWESAPRLPMELVAPLVKGADDAHAKMVITEFADFRCPHCKHAVPVFKAFIASHPDAQLRFMPWPLDGECNTSMTDSNGASCLLARVVYCAQSIGQKGWQAHDAIYDTQENYVTVDAVRSAIPEIAKQLGLDAGSLVACSDAAETKTQIEKQAAVGTALNIQGTPSVFVNGKKLQYGQVLPLLQEVHSRISSAAP